MKQIISKKVIALYPGGGLLQNDFFERIREKAFNHSPYSTDEDTGINRTKKTVIKSPGLGTNDRGHNSGAGSGLGRDENESSDKSLSSGYNDGERADDETGPGNTSIIPNPYHAVDTNEVFIDLAIKNQGNNDSIADHYKGILNKEPVKLPRRYPVDRH